MPLDDVTNDVHPDIILNVLEMNNALLRQIVNVE
jgi:hypothetical protein